MKTNSTLFQLFTNFQKKNHKIPLHIQSPFTPTFHKGAHPYLYLDRVLSSATINHTSRQHHRRRKATKKNFHSTSWKWKNCWNSIFLTNCKVLILRRRGLFQANCYGDKCLWNFRSLAVARLLALQDTQEHILDINLHTFPCTWVSMSVYNWKNTSYRLLEPLKHWKGVVGQDSGKMIRWWASQFFRRSFFSFD